MNEITVPAVDLWIHFSRLSNEEGHRFRAALDSYRRGDAEFFGLVDEALRENTRGRFWDQPVLEPTSVVGAAWLQLAEMIKQGVKVDRCAAPMCDNWFAVKKGRYVKECCSEACRKRLWRAKQETPCA